VLQKKLTFLNGLHVEAIFIGTEVYMRTEALPVNHTPDTPPVADADEGAYLSIPTGHMSSAAVEAYAEGTLVGVSSTQEIVDSCGDNREPTKKSARHITE
jgi:hypothetical protein